MQTLSVYDRLATGYLSPGRRSTTTVFRELQRAPIRQCLQQIARCGRYYSAMRYLIVGAGPLGHTDELLHAHRVIGPYLDEIDPGNITYLDASMVILDHCRKSASNVVGELFPGREIGTFVNGLAEALGRVIAPASQDVVIGALCDHFELDAFFSSSMQVLKPGGALITTFPADGINRVVRERIYNISASLTRFVVDGVEHLVPSQLMTTESLRELYERHGFVDTFSRAIAGGATEPSETLVRAARLMNRSITSLPVLVAGLGYKASY